MGLILESQGAESFVDSSALEAEFRRGGALLEELLAGGTPSDRGSLGWLRCDRAAGPLAGIEEKAAEVREEAEVFVLVGVGGSNQAARGAIEALGRGRGPRVVYAGNTLSARYLGALLEELEGKSVYLNVIAKNFQTLEPGSHFRVLRRYLEDRYGASGAARRVVVTGSRGSRLEELAGEKGYRFLDFPQDVGGRYSAFTPVALFPMAVAGLDLRAYLQGGGDQERAVSASGAENPALRYAALRNLLFRGGFLVEVLASFEPDLGYFGRWWWQLFGESEGKGGTGIYPSFAQYSEDLHSIGQYLQEGQRVLMETFLSVRDPGASFPFPGDPDSRDGFDYLEGMDFAAVNRVAEGATKAAHEAGGVPCSTVSVDRLDEYHFGQLYYFFMLACAVSGKLLGVNPFDQEGVEAYKRGMFAALRVGEARK